MPKNIIHVYKDKAGEFRFRVYAGNGEIEDASHEGKKNRQEVIADAQRQWPGLSVHIVDETE